VLTNFGAAPDEAVNRDHVGDTTNNS